MRIVTVSPQPPRVQVLLSAVLVFVTTLTLYHFPARLFFDTALRGVRPYGLAYVVVVALMTILGGRRLGFLTLGLTTLGALFLLPPRSSLQVGDVLGWGELTGLLLVSIAVVMSTDLAWPEAHRRPRPERPRVTQTPFEEAQPTAGGLRELSEWWAAIGGTQRSWLLLGKGPSFERRKHHNLRSYTTIAINHVVREMPVFAASAVNYDVVGDCADDIYRNCRYLLMPRYPHSVQGDADRPLEALFEDYPVLAAMSREGRLVWYNLSCDPPVPGSPVIQNAGFSVGILFNLLGQMGARHLRTLGIDGGQAYARSFADMEEHTRLANGMPSYDYQFGDIMTAVEKFGLDYSPLAPLTLYQRLRMLRCTPAAKEPMRLWLRRAPWLSSLPRKSAPPSTRRRAGRPRPDQ